MLIAPDAIPDRISLAPPMDFPAGYYRLQTSPLRGHQFHAEALWLHLLQPGDPLSLHAEPANPHDRYAVRVHDTDGHHLGYLPRESNHVVSRMLRQGAPLTAMVAWLSPESNPPLSLWVLWEREPSVCPDVNNASA